MAKAGKHTDSQTIKFLIGVVIVLLILVLLQGVVSGNVRAIEPIGEGGSGSTQIAAHSCNADLICEIAGRLLSPGNLWLTSQTGFVKIEGDLTLATLGSYAGVQFLSNDMGSLTVIPGSGVAKLVGDLTLSQPGAYAGVQFLTNTMGSLTIQPGSRAAKIEGSLTIVDNLTLPYHVGNGNAYLCINSYGVVFRSPQPCA